MKLYRFSPIKSKEELLKAIEHVHFSCFQLCKQSLLDGQKLKGARIFPRQDLDMIELHDPDVDVCGYLTTNHPKVQAKQTEKST